MQKIGRYEVDAEIGRGAMGVVYRACDPELDRLLAVKTYTLPPGLDDDKQREYRQRFQREARAAARLSHPGIVTVFDAGEDPETDLPFIAMEYVPGKSLAELLETEGRLPLDRVLQIAERLAGGLGAAHVAGIVHRDVKPANILVHESEDVIKIADFGVARVKSSTLTQSGSSVGSPAYMSPEQIQGREVDHRSDLFSLAVILYEALSGERPFAGDDLAGMVYSIVHETPIPVSKHCPNVGNALDAFFDRALSKDPAQRFPDAESFREGLRVAVRPAAEPDLERTLVGSPPPVREDTGRPARFRPNRLALTGALGFVLLVAGWAILSEKDAHLHIDVKASIDGELTLLVDGEEIYEQTLDAPETTKGTKKLLNTIKQTVTGSGHQTFEALVDVEPGPHEIRAVLTPERGESSTDTVVVDLEPGETRRLKLVASGKQGSVSLRAN